MEKKPMLKTNEMIEHLKSKNIKFEKISETEAELYLKNNNNYYNLTSYKNNFEKYYINGKFVDIYVDLDFAYLIDLAIIDFELRLLLFDMIIDIEHYLKMRILNTIENITEEDGYITVNEFLEQDYNTEKKIHNSIIHKIGTNSYQKMFTTYINENQKLENIPIWEFLEIITFGDLIKFYEFYTNKYNLKSEKEDVYILRDIVKLRNAVCHNNCILSELNKKDNHYPSKYKIMQFLKTCNISSKVKINKLSNSRIRQITYTLYMFNEIVTSNEIKEKINFKLQNLFYNRIIRNKEYYNSNKLLKSIYNYFAKIISNSYK